MLFFLSVSVEEQGMHKFATERCLISLIVSANKKRLRSVPLPFEGLTFTLLIWGVLPPWFTIEVDVEPIDEVQKGMKYLTEKVHATWCASSSIKLIVRYREILVLWSIIGSNSSAKPVLNPCSDILILPLKDYTDTQLILPFMKVELNRHRSCKY